MPDSRTLADARRIPARPASSVVPDQDRAVSGGPEILVMDPYRPYAVSYIELAARRYGVRTVAYYTDLPRMRRYRPDFPTLTGPLVSASYAVGEHELDRFAEVLRERHWIVGVVPYMEPSLASSTRLAELLGLSWAQPGVLELFRDKAALKEHLRSVPGGPRINRTCRVATPDDVLDAVGTGGYPRYVLKPNDGFGNSRIGFFDAATPRAELDEYFAAVGADVLMEEFVEGPELFVDGQVDEQGRAIVYSVWQYDRAAVNGRANVSMGQRTVHRDDPLFAPCATYAAAVMEASGLRRSPFHLELKVDDEGPCLIEVGARLAGGYLAHLDDRAHGALDTLGAAMHHYLFDDAYGDYGLDWDHYDATVVGLVNGVSTQSGRIWSRSGLEAAERVPGFVRWTKRPGFGDRVQPTVDILSQPWQVAVECRDADDYARAAREIRDAIAFRAGGQGPRATAGRYLALAGPAWREARGRLARGATPRPLDD